MSAIEALIVVGICMLFTLSISAFALAAQKRS